MASPTILIVEDNADNRDIYRTILGHYGYPVLEADNGDDGVAMAREHHPSVILMDVAMPGMNGWDATRVLKADPATAGIRIIALTAYAMAEDRRKAEEAGCDGYLAKPVEPRRVLEEVRRVLDGAPAE
jgi:two-component system cell cycle response regulator DivK